MKNKIIFEPGTQIGEWTIIKQDPLPDKYRNVFYVCKCKCGLIKSVSAYNLKRGGSKRCRPCSLTHIGNILKAIHSKDEVGNKYGSWEVIEYAGRIIYQSNPKGYKLYKVKHICGAERIPKDFGHFKKIGLRCWICKPKKE